MMGCRIRWRSSPHQDDPLGGSYFVEKLTDEMERIDPSFEHKQIDGLAGTRARRGSAAVERNLTELRRVAGEGGSLMPSIVAAARVRATEGEMIAAMQEVFGTYTESLVF
jgi:methylmalonyl-CoA mutase N-terminal domain/subunit